LGTRLGTAGAPFTPSVRSGAAPIVYRPAHGASIVDVIEFPARAPKVIRPPAALWKRADREDRSRAGEPAAAHHASPRRYVVEIRRICDVRDPPQRTARCCASKQQK
jgi:hypothetical protein